MIPRPEPGECADVYQKYIDELAENDILITLAAQQQETEKMIRTIKEADGDHKYAAGKWSIKEVLGHMIDAERVFTYRAMCFARLDAGPLPPMDENDYVSSARFGRRTFASLIEEYSNQRRSNIGLFSSFDEDTIMRIGVASGCEFTVRSLIFIIGGHERHHLNILAQRYLGNI